MKDDKQARPAAKKKRVAPSPAKPATASGTRARKAAATPARVAKERRTQESRSAGMRAQLLQAAIDQLYEHGYAATTTTAVCERARVSRGAMLHHFPTRVDLMLYVVQAVYEEELRLYHEALDKVTDPHRRMLMMPRVLWDVLGRPAGVAVLEVMQGSRSDPVLSTRLTALQAAIEKDSLKQAGTLLGKSGVSLEAARLMVWAIRGLSIARVLSPDPEQVARSVDMLQKMLAAALDSGVLKGKPARRR